MLCDLIERYGEGAIVRAHPVMLESGETYRWELQIDGVAAPDAIVHVRRDPDSRDGMVMLLIHDGEEIEMMTWRRRGRPGEPAAVIRTLGDLRRERRRPWFHPSSTRPENGGDSPIRDDRSVAGFAALGHAWRL